MNTKRSVVNDVRLEFYDEYQSQRKRLDLQQSGLTKGGGVGFHDT